MVHSRNIKRGRGRDRGCLPARSTSASPTSVNMKLQEATTDDSQIASDVLVMPACLSIVPL